MAEVVSGAEESRLQKICMIIKFNPEADVQLRNVYSECKIPLWTRNTLSLFIESIDWPGDADAQTSLHLYTTFIEQANLKVRLGETEELKEFQHFYPESRAADFVKAMRKCMITELTIIGTKLEPEEPEKVLTEAWQSLKNTVNSHLAQSEKRDGLRKRKVNQVDNTYSLSVSVSNAVNNIQTAGGWVVNNLTSCSKTCYDELSRWYKEKNVIKYKKIEGADQKLMHLEHIQLRFCDTHKKCKEMVEVVSAATKLIQGLIDKKNIADMPEEICSMEKIHGEMHAIQTELEERSIVIEEQPDQIIEIKDHSTKNKETFKIKLRSMLNLRIEKAKVELVNEDDLDSQRTSKAEVSHKPPIRNGDRTILSEIKIKNFVRPINQNVLFVPYAFQLMVKIANHEKMLQMYSHECILGSHTQISKAQGYQLWSSAFSTQKSDVDEPFQVREEVPWKEFYPILSDYFYKEANYRFTVDNINCLSEMFEHLTVPWKKLVIEPSPNCPKRQKEKNFTIWDWLCGAKNILKEYPGLCREGLIHGFLTKDRADELLKQEQEGSFLLRFSHTFLDGKTTPTGGLSVVVNTYNKRKGKVEVLHSAPFSLKSDKVDRLPKQDTFGMWLGQFITKSNENTEVTLKQLCGTCRPLEETFKSFMLHSPTPTWKDYHVVNKKLVMGNGSNNAVVNMETEQGNILQERIEELVKIADIRPGLNVVLIAPTPDEPIWKMMYDTANIMPSPAVSTDYDNNQSPASSLMSPSSASEYHSATEDQMDIELDLPEECVGEPTLTVLCRSLGMLQPGGEGPVRTEPNTDSLELQAYLNLPQANSVCERLPQIGDPFESGFGHSFTQELNTPTIPESVENMFQ
ncbi:uncharacterized protein LOC135501531 [Lineus longissimus]|uniref:uncharacterized protein LOC135501531 n=1 Tax=Lineus longissimus TaxID=88925 RepID=UPI002B4C361F